MYHVLLDKKRNCLVRTTSQTLVDELIKKYKLIKVFTVTGRQIGFTEKDCNFFTISEYKKFREEKNEN